MPSRQDAKDAKTADFIVNMKEPIPDKEIPAVGSELKLLKDGGPELDGTYDTYTQVPASATAAASSQIVLKDGILQTAKKACGAQTGGRLTTPRQRTNTAIDRTCAPGESKGSLNEAALRASAQPQPTAMVILREDGAVPHFPYTALPRLC